MKNKSVIGRLVRLGPGALGCWALGCAVSGWAATTNVSVVSFAFNPPNVTINPNDKVIWTWSGNFHSTTSDTSLWDSGVQNVPFSFTNAFPSAGTFPYHCTLHATSFNMRGTVTVASANVPPTVAITAPTSGATFAAPWTGTLQATVGDSDDPVAKVDFFAGTNLLGTVSNPPASLRFTVTNLPAGSYSFTAVATDSLGASTTSAAVPVSVVTPEAIVLGSPQRLPDGSFQFTYTANPGLSYVVRRSANLPVWTPLVTNTASATPVTFVDTTAAADVGFYSVQLLLNP